MSSPSFPAVVLLDIDGTLLDSNEAHTQAWLQALERHGYRADHAAVRERIGKGGDKVLAELYGLAEDDVLAKRITQDCSEIFLTQYLPTLKPTPGARALLEHLRSTGMRLVVATSATAQELDALLQQAGIGDLVDHATTSSDAEHSKPDADIVQVALRKAGGGAGRAVMLGDTPYDIQSARAAGVDTIALRCGGWWDDAALSGAIEIHDDPAALLAHIGQSRLGKSS